MFERFQVGLIPWSEAGIQYWYTLPGEVRQKALLYERIREVEEAEEITAIQQAAMLSSVSKGVGGSGRVRGRGRR